MTWIRHLLLVLFSLLPALAWAALTVEVRVEGIEGPQYDNVMQRLSLVAEREHPLLDEHRLEQLHERAAGEIREALKPFGYYQPKVKSRLSEQDGTWTALYQVTPGEPVRVRERVLQIDGAAAEDPAFMAWREAFPLHVGDVLEHAPYEQAKRELLQLARDRGYFSARLVQQALEITLARNSARVVLQLDSGPRMRFGQIQFDDVDLDDELLHRYLTFKPGEPYDADRLFQMQRDLSDSDYFEFVEVRADPDTANNGRVPVVAHLRLKPYNRYTFGIGYGTDTGPRISLGWERRRVNEQGHRFRIETTASQVLEQVSADYRIPLLRHPNTDFVSFTGSWEREVLDTAERETYTVGSGLTMMLAKWQRTVGITLQNETYTVADQADTTTLVLPSVAVQRVDADNRLFPTRGWRLGAEVRGATETLGSDASLLQGILRAKAVMPALGGRFLTRLDVGGSRTPDFSRIPVSLRFFAGGDNSIRGYSYKSLGPTNSDGEVVGGHHLLVASGEYQYFFGPMFGTALFYDAGNAFDGTELDVKEGAGVGLHWRLPFGSLRFDVATPVHERDLQWRLHLTVGPDL